MVLSGKQGNWIFTPAFQKDVDWLALSGVSLRDLVCKLPQRWALVEDLLDLARGESN